MRAKVREFIAANSLFCPGDRVGVAVSGGVDSVSLLHALKSLAELKLDLTVCHLDHGLRPESNRDAEFVQDLAARSGLPFVLARLEVAAYAKAKHFSLEMAARDLRYAELTRIAADLHLCRVALGHHLDDQVETILLRILRGTGLEGLSGMKPVRAGGLFVRPLLGVSRAEILSYAKENGLAWVEDATNRETDILRNRVRLLLLPCLRAEYNHHIDQALLGVSALARETVDYLDEVLMTAWPDLNVHEAPGGLFFSSSALASLPTPLSRLALRRLLARAGGDPGRLSLRATRRIWAFILGAGGPRLSVPGGLVLIRHGSEFFLGRSIVAPVMSPKIVPVPGEVPLPDGRILAAEWWEGNLPDWAGVTGNEVFLDGDVPAWPLTVRSRRPGDRFFPLGLGGQKKVKEVLIEAKIPRDARNAVPLVTDSRDRVVWLAGIRLDDRFRVGGTTKRTLHLTLREQARPLCC